METKQRTPTLEEVIADKKELEHNLEIANGKSTSINSEINNLNLNIQLLKKDLDELDKSEKFYEAKYDENAKRLSNLAFVKRKYEMNVKWFENYKLNTPLNVNEGNANKYAEAVEQRAKLKQEKESLLQQEEELTAIINKNNQQYREIIEKIKNTDLIALLK